MQTVACVWEMWTHPSHSACSPHHNHAFLFCRDIKKDSIQWEGRKNPTRNPLHSQQVPKGQPRKDGSKAVLRVQVGRRVSCTGFTSSSRCQEAKANSQGLLYPNSSVLELSDAWRNHTVSPLCNSYPRSNETSNPPMGVDFLY